MPPLQHPPGIPRIRIKPGHRQILAVTHLLAGQAARLFMRSRLIVRLPGGLQLRLQRLTPPQSHPPRRSYGSYELYN
ncbi:MAG: hypothetical protein ACRDXB_06775 [Actinomycetes bacterium]